MLLSKLLTKLRTAPFYSEKERGLSITEIFIALGILGSTVGTVSYIIPKIFINQDRIESISVRDGIASSVKRAVSPSNLFYSANAFTDTGNIALKACIDGDPATICRTTDRSNPLDFKLAYPRANNPFIIAGTQASPALYKRGGGVCPNPSTCNIDWEVSAYFSAVCPSNSTNCGDADNIRVRYLVKNRPSKGQREIPSWPNEDEFRDPSRGFILIPIFKDFRGGGCPALSIATSILPTGAPVCTCQPGTKNVQTSPNSPPDCRPNSPGQCDNLRQRLLGYDINMNPICKDRDVQCNQILSTAPCNGWVRSVNLGVCKVYDSPTKGGNQKVARCAVNQHECCRPI